MKTCVMLKYLIIHIHIDCIIHAIHTDYITHMNIPYIYDEIYPCKEIDCPKEVDQRLSRRSISIESPTYLKLIDKEQYNWQLRLQTKAVFMKN